MPIKPSDSPAGTTRHRLRFTPGASTRARGKTLWQFIHGYFYARWPYGYIGSAIGEKWALLPLRVFFAPFLLRRRVHGAWWRQQSGYILTRRSANPSRRRRQQ